MIQEYVSYLTGDRQTVAEVQCLACANVFWIRGGSPEFYPGYCCYCGTRFRDLVQPSKGDNLEHGREDSDQRSELDE